MNGLYSAIDGINKQSVKVSIKVGCVDLDTNDKSELNFSLSDGGSSVTCNHDKFNFSVSENDFVDIIRILKVLNNRI